MKIRSIQLQNFRGFEALDLTLDPSLTLLIGENGAGKTAVLEGLAVALGGFLRLMSGFVGLTGVVARDIGMEDVRVRSYEHEGLLDRQQQWPVRVVVEGTLDGQPVHWEHARTGGETARAWGAGSSYTPRECDISIVRDGVAAPGGMPGMAQVLIEAVARGEPRVLPVVAYYGTRRLWPRGNVTEVKRGVGSRFDGYADALDAGSSDQKLASWMFQQTLVEMQRRREVPQLRAVQRAVCDCIDGASRFFFDINVQELILERGGELLPLSTLSDGYRNLVALVADVAWRASVLNPHLGAGAAAGAVGVVLIDEIDLHLHPRWQRRVLHDLRRAFPGLQFVMTTHSPQVLASARREEVRILAQSALVEGKPFVEGRDTNSLLEDVLGVSERPDDVRARIDEMSGLLDDQKYEQAKALLLGLEAQLGPDDPAVIRARWILDREAVPEENG